MKLKLQNKGKGPIIAQCYIGAVEENTHFGTFELLSVINNRSMLGEDYRFLFKWPRGGDL